MGNDKGEVFFYRISAKKDVKIPTEPFLRVSLKNEKALVRKVLFSDDFTFLFAVTDNGNIWIHNLRLSNPELSKLLDQ